MNNYPIKQLLDWEGEYKMKELMMYVETMIKIAEIDYGYKTNLSYVNGQWYSREHSREISVEEACEHILDIIKYYDKTLEEYQNL